MNEMIFRFEEPWFRPFMTHPKEDSVILQSYYNHPFAKNLNQERESMHIESPDLTYPMM